MPRELAEWEGRVICFTYTCWITLRLCLLVLLPSGTVALMMMQHKVEEAKWECENLMAKYWVEGSVEAEKLITLLKICLELANCCHNCHVLVTCYYGMIIPQLLLLVVTISCLSYWIKINDCPLFQVLDYLWASWHIFLLKMMMLFLQSVLVSSI